MLRIDQLQNFAREISPDRRLLVCIGHDDVSPCSQIESRSTFEEIFFEHRFRLHEFALQLTGRNYAEAEDLVQELYIRLARVGPVPEHIENAEHYLFSILRSLYS
jgi:DNA-directed RNA polymerase specialized sigma24 family protein